MTAFREEWVGGSGRRARTQRRLPLARLIDEASPPTSSELDERVFSDLDVAAAR